MNLKPARYNKLEPKDMTVDLLHTSVDYSKYNATGAPKDQTFIIHYFGIKPWKCRHRNRDCNGDNGWSSERTDAALYQHWWHDELEEGLSCARAPRLS